jgi:ferrous iron transport protein B
MRLSQLKDNEEAIITKVRGRGAFRKRITEMGFVKGKKVRVIKNAPLKDPVEYSIMGYDISLRRSEAALIEVITKEEAKALNHTSNYQGTITDELLKTSAEKKGKEIQIALVGNPNCGKTTLFNYASRSKEHVGNYSGVTVESKVASFQQNGYTFNITDLPGTYSLSAYSPEELFVRKYILGELPDVIINVVDASNLERNLYLTTQLIDMDVKVILALNMYDELKKKGDQFDYESLGKMLGIPIIPTIGSKGYGIKEVFNKAIDVYEDRDPVVRHVHINYGKCIEGSIKKIQDTIWQHKGVTDRISSRFYAIKMLEKDEAAAFSLSRQPNAKTISEVSEQEIQKVESHLQDDSETLIADAKYGFIAGALKETYKGNVITRRRRTDRIDNILTHKYLGFPLFILFMLVMFQATFSLGAYPMDWIEQGVNALGSLLSKWMPSGPLKDLLINGVVDGVGGVVVFLPNILILFFFISFMEDTGYMARAAFIMDKIMHRVGLHGRSFIPLLMGFGCNVPAIMATRTIENRNNRLVTMLINPFMSCSARLPVYVLMISAFFPKHPGTVLFSLYAFGILMAAGLALLLKKTLFKAKEVPFVMELPPYRMPTLKSTTRHMWHKGAQYLKKMGGVILIASVLIWALGYFPRNEEVTNTYEQKIAQTEKQYNQQLTTNLTKNQQEAVIKAQKNEIRHLELEKASVMQEQSYIGHIGRLIEPVMRPLGFDWKMSVSLLTGVAAKEVVVSTMGVLYQAEGDDEELNASLSNRLREETYKEGPKKGEKAFTPLVAFGFMLFILIYFPCVATIAAIKKESGHWKWAAFSILYSTGMAWLIAFLTYQIGSIFI